MSTSAAQADAFYLRSRAERIVGSVPAYGCFEVVPLPLDDWRSLWLPGLERDGLRVGLNWSGASANGYDLAPTEVEHNLVTRQSE